jgi:uncharacterized membrane protein
MTAAADTTAARQQQAPVGRIALWFGLFGAPAAWSIQELVGYGVVAHACYPFEQPLLSVAMPSLVILDLLVSLLMLLLGALAGLTAYRSWTRTGEHSNGESRTHFMALSGIILSVLFLFSILMNTILLFIQPACS